MPRRSKKPQPTPVERSELGSSREEILCMYPKRPRATLPNEILINIATFSSPTVLAACSQVSKTFLEIFGPRLWYRVTLKNLQKRTKDLSHAVIRQLLSYVGVLEVHDKHSESCTWVREELPNLHTIVFASTRGNLCTRMGKERALESTQICGCIPVGRPIHIVLHGHTTPIPSNPIDMLPYGEIEANQPQVVEVSISFTLAKRQIFDWPVYKNGGIVGDYPLYRLNLIFTPVSTASLRQIYFARVWDKSPCALDTSVYRRPESLASTDGFGDNIFSLMAVACLSVSSRCIVTIVNTDQMPLFEGYDKRYTAHRFTRSKTGEPMKVEGIEGEWSGTRRVEPEYWTTACKGTQKIAYEAKLQERVDIIKRVIKRWMELLLKEQGRDNELEARWNKIKFKSLAEYESQWDMIKVTNKA